MFAEDLPHKSSYFPSAHSPRSLVSTLVEFCLRRRALPLPAASADVDVATSPLSSRPITPRVTNPDRPRSLARRLSLPGGFGCVHILHGMSVVRGTRCPTAKIRKKENCRNPTFFAGHSVFTPSPRRRRRRRRRPDGRPSCCTLRSADRTEFG